MRYKSDLESLVLAALGEGAMHGYGITRSIRQRSEGVLKLGEGQLYPILHRLEEAQMIKGDWEMQEGRPPRKVYSITQKGEGKLAEQRSEWRKFAEAVSRVMAEPKLEARTDA